MSIKTWSQRITPESTAVAQLRAMQAEIDELRAALKERDAELGHTKTLLGSSEAQISTLKARVMVRDGTIAAQRKVLEQALESLELSWPMRGRYISTTEFETDCAKHQAAITAIQEQLK